MADKKGLLLINLGSPQAPTPKAVGKYLTQFLTDKYVIDLPFVLRQALVRAVIVPFRKHKSAEAYQKIWRQEGSPLVHFTKEFAEKVQAQLGPEISVRWAMRYGEPSIPSQLQNWPVDKLHIVPLYPQYAESSTQTALDLALDGARKLGLRPSYLQDFYDHPAFIQSLAQQIQTSIDSFRPDHVMMSFHGLPEHHLNKLHPEVCHQDISCCAAVTTKNRFCYRAQSFATANALRAHLHFAPERTSICFQSRLGRRPWIKPYTDFEISKLAASGVKRVLVACPSFVADCLETLEEIQMRLRDQFRSEGGTDLQLVPALNAETFWIQNFCSMIQSFIDVK